MNTPNHQESSDESQSPVSEIRSEFSAKLEKAIKIADSVQSMFGVETIPEAKKLIEDLGLPVSLKKMTESAESALSWLGAKTIQEAREVAEAIDALNKAETIQEADEIMDAMAKRGIVTKVKEGEYIPATDEKENKVKSKTSHAAKSRKKIKKIMNADQKGLENEIEA
jgi:3-deoxy-D-manno-octulosonic acid (KDO) 8-phosphate synthase